MTGRLQISVLTLLLVLGSLESVLGFSFDPVNDSDFEVKVVQASKEQPEKIIVVLFCASWHTPCSHQEREIHAMLDTYWSSVKVYWLDTDKNQQDEKMNIKGIPFTYIYRQGKAFRVYRGIVEEPVLSAGIQSAMDLNRPAHTATPESESEQPQ